MIVKVLCGLLLISSIVGCQFDPFADDYTRTKPLKADLIGTYVLTSESMTNTAISQLKSEKGLSPGNYTLTLYADGTFKYINMPVWVGDWANGKDEWSIRSFKSGSGKWEIAVVGGVGDGSKVVDVWGLDLSPAAVPGAHATLSSEKPPYTVVFGYGDPDMGDAMFYERESTAIQNNSR